MELDGAPVHAEIQSYCRLRLGTESELGIAIGPVSHQSSADWQSLPSSGGCTIGEERSTVVAFVAADLEERKSY